MACFQVSCGQFITVITKNVVETKRGVSIVLTYRDNNLEPGPLIALIQATSCIKGPDLNNLTKLYLGGDPPPNAGGKAPGKEKIAPDAGGKEGVKRPTPDAGGKAAGKKEAPRPDDDGKSVDERLITPDYWYIDAPGKDRKCPAFGMYFSKRDEGTAWRRWKSAVGKGKTGSDGGLGYTTEQNRNLIPAHLDDAPSRSFAGSDVDKAFHHFFEVAAVCICSDGKVPHGTVRGAITWGYKVDHLGNLEVDTPVATNRPSDNWQAAAKLWNDIRGAGGAIPGAPRLWSR